jgi:glycosyltransferase involved in cell wall biosynthesis
MQEKTISIFMPARNEAKYINETIESLRMQTHINFKLIISNNYSTDNTEEIVIDHVKSDSRISLIIPPHEMTAKQHFEYAKNFFDTEFHMYAGAHDLYNKDYIKKTVEVIEANPTAVVVGAKCLHFTDDGKIFHIPSLDLNTNGILPLERICIFLQGTYYNSLAYGLFRTRLTTTKQIPTILGFDHLEMACNLINGDAITCNEQLIYFRYPLTAADPKRQIQSIGANDGKEGWINVINAFNDLLNSNFSGEQRLHGKQIIKSIFLTRYAYMLEQFQVSYENGKQIADEIFMAQ